MDNINSQTNEPERLGKTADSFVQGSHTYFFVGYVVHHHETNCRCGSTVSWTTLHRAFATGPARFLAKRLIPCDDLPDGEPVVIFRLPPEKVPLCVHCLKTRPDELVVLQTDDRAWNEAIRQVIIQKTHPLGDAATAKTSTKAPLPTVDIRKANF